MLDVYKLLNSFLTFSHGLFLSLLPVPLVKIVYRFGESFLYRELVPRTYSVSRPPVITLLFTMASISRTPSMASQKQPLPHVSALIQSAESRSASFDARKTLSSQRTAKLRSAPASPQSSSLDLRSTPNIHLLASMPDFSPQDFPPVPTHGRRKSSGVNHSPASKAASIAGESIFELPTPMPMESPNSSVAVSFVAELEDTSEVPNEPVPPLPYKAHLVAPADTSVLFKPNKLTVCFLYFGPNF